MELYKKLVPLGCFSHKDMVYITGSENAALWSIKDYLNKGYISRIRRDLYVVISLETGQPIANRYQIASHVTDDAFISHHSAFEFYGLANQVFYEVYFASTMRVCSFFL